MVQLTRSFQTSLFATLFAVYFETSTAQTINLSLQQRSSPGGPFNLERELHALRRRYNPTAPSHHAIRRAVGDVHAAGYYKDLNNVYYVPVKVGTPAQDLNLVLDTASPSSWLSILNEPTIPMPHFKPNASSTYVVVKNATSEDKDGGVIGSDTFTLGTFNVTTQPFYLSRFVGPYKYFKDDISGYLGFGRWPETGSGELASFWTTLQESGQLTSKSVGFYLSRPTSPKPPSRQLGGIVTLGGTNTTLYTGDIEFHELNDIGLNTKYWSANIQKLTVNGREFPIEIRRTAVIDTTTSLISGPSDEVAKIWATIPNSKLTTTNSGVYSFPCNQQINVTISFGGKDWPINSQDINLGPVAPGLDQCYGSIVDIEKHQDVDKGQDPLWVLGTSFLRNTYFVLRETTPPSVGFAQLSEAALSGTIAPSPTGDFQAIPVESNGAVSGGTPAVPNAAQKISGTIVSNWFLVVGVALGAMLF